METAAEYQATPAAGNLPRGVLLLYLVIFLGGNFLIGYRLLFVDHNPFKFVLRFYNFHTIVYPALAIAPFMLGMHRWLRGKDAAWKRVAIYGALTVFLGFGAQVYATHIEPYRLQVREVTIETPKITEPLRILHISDIQTDGIGSYEARAFQMMNDLKPDLVIHTGDLLQNIDPEQWVSEYDKLVALFQSLEAPLGVWNVIGDCDAGLHNALIAPNSPIATLKDRSTTIVTPAGDTISIYGLDLMKSHYGERALGGVQSWLDAQASGTFTLLIGHGPDYILELRKLPLDLCLAGHTHGGQVRPPFGLPPPVTLSRIPARYARGFHEIGETRLNVSAGIGAEHAAGLPSIRILCPPEMTLITLKPAQRP